MLKQNNQSKENENTPQIIILSIGSNIGKSQENINSAIEIMQEVGIIRNVRTSSFFSTEPVGFSSNNWFYNIAVSATTYLTYYQFLFFVKSIEYQFGRKVKISLSDRVLDIDILFFDNIVVSNKLLTIPHPKLQERNFVLIPLNEIEPDFMHPILNKTIAELLKSTNDFSEVNRLAI